eukprot:Hpha_TRINITY_DN3266_c0_g2::TRINITY_DN3266_c0_g2_i1::g.185885::m.185885
MDLRGEAVGSEGSLSDGIDEPTSVPLNSSTSGGAVLSSPHVGPPGSARSYDPELYSAPVVSSSNHSQKPNGGGGSLRQRSGQQLLLPYEVSRPAEIPSVRGLGGSGRSCSTPAKGPGPFTPGDTPSAIGGGDAEASPSRSTPADGWSPVGSRLGTVDGSPAGSMRHHQQPSVFDLGGEGSPAGPLRFVSGSPAGSMRQPCGSPAGSMRLHHCHSFVFDTASMMGQEVGSEIGGHAAESIDVREQGNNSPDNEDRGGGTPSPPEVVGTQQFPPTPEVWPRLVVTCKEKPALAGTYDVLYAGNRRHNGRPVWACHAKRIYSCTEGGEAGRWAIAVGTDAPLSNRRQVQSQYSHSDDSLGLPSFSDAWEWFNTEDGRWVPAPGTSVAAVESPRQRRDSGSGPPLDDPQDQGPPPMTQPGTGRILSPATVRQGESLDSPPLGSGPLQADVIVEVEEIRGRRARISAPVEGWLSLYTRGATLVTALEAEVYCEELHCSIIDCYPPAVVNLRKGGPVFAAGLRQWDRIVFLQQCDRPVRTLRGAADLLHELQEADAVRVGYTREGHPRSVVVKVDRPQCQQTELEVVSTTTSFTQPASRDTSGSCVAPTAPVTPQTVPDTVPETHKALPTVPPSPSLGAPSSPSSASIRSLQDSTHRVWAVLVSAIAVDESVASRAARKTVLKAVHEAEAQQSTVHSPAPGARRDACCKTDVLYRTLVGSSPSQEVRLAFERAVRGAFESMAMAGRGTGQYVEKKNFRLLMIALQRHLELYQLFGSSCLSIDAANAQRATPVLARWGCTFLKGHHIIAAAAAEAAGDTVPFPQFCTWAASTNLEDVARDGPAGGRQSGGVGCTGRTGGRTLAGTPWSAPPAPPQGKSPAPKGRSGASGLKPPPGLPSGGTRRPRLVGTPRQRKVARYAPREAKEMTPPKPTSPPHVIPFARRDTGHAADRSYTPRPTSGRARWGSPSRAVLASPGRARKTRSTSHSAPQPRRVATDSVPVHRRVAQASSTLPMDAAASVAASAVPVITPRANLQRYRADAATRHLSRSAVTR